MTLLVGFSSDQFNGFSIEPRSVPLNKILKGGPPRDGIPALLEPHFVPAKDVDYLQDRDRVLGVVGRTQEKAYPIKILNWHEVVNDVLDSDPIVVTYCPLCGSGIAFFRTLDGQNLTFGVSGLLYESDLLMYDHQSESLWSQIGMEAITGKSLGQRLEPLFVEQTTWGDWRRSHPDSLVLSTKTGYVRDYERDPYRGYGDSDELYVPITNTSPQFSPKQWVLGLAVKGKFKAYPFSEFPHSSGVLHDRFNGQEIEIQWDVEAKKATAWSLATGHPLSAWQMYWFAWVAFHPDTDVFISH